MKRSKSPGGDPDDDGPDAKKLQASPRTKVEDRRDTSPVDSEAETEIIDGGSRNNTPLKRSQALRSGIHNNRDRGENGADEKISNGSDRSRIAGEISGPVASARKKRKAGSDMYGNGDEHHNNHHRGSDTRGADKSRGSPVKKARLSSGSEGESEDDQQRRNSRMSSKDSNNNQKPTRVLKRRSAGGETQEDAGSHASTRHAKFQVPVSKADQSSQRATTQEPRQRSSSPVKNPHKRSSSFHTSTQQATEPPRRLRNRRGSTEDAHGSDDRSNVGHARNLATEGRTDMDRNGRTPLAKACADGQIARVKQILEQSHDDVNVPDYAENTPLQSAALDGHAEIVQLLIAAGCDVHCSNMDGDTPLIDAVTNGHIEVVQILLEQGVDPRRKNFAGQFPKDVLPDDEETHDVLAKMLDDTIKQRIESGIDDERPTYKSETHLTQTTSRGRRGHLGEKSLHFVQPNLNLLRKYAGDGDMTGVGYVLECNIKADNSCMVAAAAGGHADVLSLMLADNNRPDPDPDPKDVKNNTPILAAIGRGNLEVIELLLAQKGFDAQRRTVDDKTYYEIAQDRKGPRWEKESQMLSDAYNGTSNTPRPSSSPVQAPKRKRLMSGREKAEEVQAKAEEARIKAEENVQVLETERRVSGGDRLRSEAEYRRGEQEAQQKTWEAASREEEVRKKAEEEQTRAEEAERKRKQEEDEKRRVREEEEARRKRQQEEEDIARKKFEAEEAERKRKEAEEAERKKKEAEAEEAARREREALEREEKRRVEQAARQRYLESLPRSLRKALTPEGRYPRDSPSNPEGRYRKSLRDWLPLWLVKRSVIDPHCPLEFRDECWLPNFQSAVFLHHDRLDTCSNILGWQTLPLSRAGREKLWFSAPLSDWLVRDEKWLLADVERLKTCGIPFQSYGKNSKILNWQAISETVRSKWLDLPDDQSFWVKLSDFIAETKPEKSPHLKGLRITTTSWSFFSSSESAGVSHGGISPAEYYIDGEPVANSTDVGVVWPLNGN